MQSSKWQVEFPQFRGVPREVQDLVEAGELIDNSWSEDHCPSFIPGNVPRANHSDLMRTLWIDHESPALREIGPDSHQYLVTHYGIGRPADSVEDALKLFRASDADFTGVFADVPLTKERAIERLQLLRVMDLAWDLDSDPQTVIRHLGGDRTFDDLQAKWCATFVGVLNELFGREAESPSAHNAGAWHAAGLAGWIDLESNDE